MDVLRENGQDEQRLQVVEIILENLKMLDKIVASISKYSGTHHEFTNFLPSFEFPTKLSSSKGTLNPKFASPRHHLICHES